MVQQITKGIKISVETVYNGPFFKGIHSNHAFSYSVTIENNTKDNIQVLGRYWEIFDSLNNKEIVEGKGIVGKTPIIAPFDSHKYSSNCFLVASAGSMKGHYNILNLTTEDEFNVQIPTFQLTTKALSN